MRVIRTSVRKRMIAGTASAAALMLPVGCIAVFGGISQHCPNVKNELCFDIANMNGNSVEVRYVSDLTEQTEMTYEEPEAEAVSEISVPQDTDSADIKKYLNTVNMNTNSDDLGRYTVHSGIIAEEHFGRGTGPIYISLPEGGQVRNCTDLSADTLEYESTVPSGITLERYSDEPQILIMHTHTSESYEPYEKSWYDAAYISRSESPENGVVAVGEAIAGELAAAGISVIHDCTVYDDPYNGAYSRSLIGTVELLDRFPTIKVVLDIHRDAIEYTDGTRVSAVTEIDGKKAAQFMVICAADDGNYDVPYYMDNFHFACELQQEAEKLYPTLTRPVLFQYCQYNQQLSKGALLIEVGSHGNSVDQAVYTGELIGRTLVSLFTGEAPVFDNALPTLSSVPLYFLDRVI